jgi:hypothetical protein
MVEGLTCFKARQRLHCLVQFFSLFSYFRCTRLRLIAGWSSGSSSGS